VKDFSSSPLTVAPLVVTWDFTGPIPGASQVRIRMLTETPMNCSVRVSSMTVVWYAPAGTVTVAEPAPWTVTWVLTAWLWPPMLIVAVIVLVCG
jgi:hypothetical protein